MFRIDNATAATILPAPKPVGTPGFFTTGSIGGQLATIVEADWMNTVQEELMAILAAAAIAPDKASNAQVIAAILALIAGQTRRRLTGPLDLYCSPSGNDNNDGLTPGTPFATPAAAYNLLVQQYDLGGQTVTIHLADGSYGPVTLSGAPLGVLSPGNIIFQGNAANPANVQVNGSTAGPGFQLAFFGLCTLSGMEISAPVSQGTCIGAAFGSTVFIENLIFGTAGAYHMTPQWGSTLAPIGPYTVAGGAACHIFAYNGGKASGEFAGAGVTITLVGTPHFSDAFVNASNNSFVEYDSTVITWSGAATGVRFAVNNHSGIYVPSGGLNYFPGSIAGVADATTFGLYAA